MFKDEVEAIDFAKMQPWEKGAYLADRDGWFVSNPHEVKHTPTPYMIDVHKDFMSKATIREESGGYYWSEKDAKDYLDKLANDVKYSVYGKEAGGAEGEW